MPKIEAGGLDVHYRLDGPEGAPLVTLSHSLAADLAMWRPQVDALSRDYRILRYDIRGHGRTATPHGPYTLEQLSDDLAALLDALRIERTHLVGLSMGGMIGQLLALREPGRLISLVLADTLAVYRPEARAMWQERIDAASGPDGMEPLVEPTLTRWFTAPFKASRPDVMEEVAAMIRATAPRGFIGCCRALMELDLIGRLPEICLPTLVLVGRQDPTTPVAGAEAIAGAIPGARLVVIEDAAHISNLEQPEAFNAALLSFLDEAA
jgi:3-oxoadipate enol-lactonase